MNAKDIINGTWGELWIDGDKVSECIALQAKVTINKAPVSFCGDLFTHNKVIGLEGKGSLKLHKASSRMIIKISANMKAGKQTVCTIVSKLADPDSMGAERVAIYEVSFDELTIADWENKKNGEEDVPFTFANWEFLDTIAPQNI
ncbi:MULTISPECIES: phage tail tube protein [Clostridium]|uniref:Phage tail tube protein n=1 Tax=Clostridium frigoriphilum TaxID=443253 RepID=A0ABU7UWH4_9CLOT|nr:phage tail tube protein [Clostridium sp. DSM 17811]MBU3098745.1 phage tail tube protein [Clostridium sp. DSM 17811]